MIAPPPGYIELTLRVSVVKQPGGGALERGGKVSPTRDAGLPNLVGQDLCPCTQHDVQCAGHIRCVTEGGFHALVWLAALG